MAFLNIRFLFLWMSQMCCQLAERMYLFLLVLTIYSLSGTNATVAQLGLLYGLPAVIIGPLAGVVVDIIDKKNILFTVSFLRGLIVMCIFLFATTLLHSMSALYLCTLAIVVITQFFIPAETSFIPLLVDKKQLMSANSVFIATFYAMGVIGMALSSWLTTRIPSTHFLFIVALLFFLSSFSLFFLPRLGSRVRIGNVLRLYEELWDGIVFAFTEKKIAHLLMMVLIISTVFSAITILGVGFTDKILHMPKANFGYLGAVGGVGMLLGVIVLNITKQLPLHRIITVGFCGAGISLLFFALASNILFSFSALAVAGFFFAWIIIPVQTGLQLFTPESHRGRIMALQNVVLNFSLSVPVLILGYCADRFGIVPVFSSLAILLLAEGSVLLLQKEHS